MADWTRRGFLGTAAGAGIARLAAAQSVSSSQPIVCRVIDSGSGRPVPARVRLVDALGNELVPLGHSRELADDAQEGDVRFQSRRYAYVDGEFRVDPRWLPIQYQVIKGYEYTIVGGELDASGVRGGAFTIPLSRWSAISEQGLVRRRQPHSPHLAQDLPAGDGCRRSERGQYPDLRFHPRPGGV